MFRQGIRAKLEGLILAALIGIARARVACLITENMIRLICLCECKVVGASVGMRQNAFHFYEIWDNRRLL
jgi:hypothetical protein